MDGIFDWFSSRPDPAVVESIQQYPAMARAIENLDGYLKRQETRVRELEAKSGKRAPEPVQAQMRELRGAVAAARTKFYGLRDQLRAGVARARAEGKLTAADLAELGGVGLAGGLGLVPVVIIGVSIAAALAGSIVAAAYIVNRGEVEKARAEAAAIGAESEAQIRAWEKQVDIALASSVPALPEPIPSAPSSGGAAPSAPAPARTVPGPLPALPPFPSNPNRNPSKPESPLFSTVKTLGSSAAVIAVVIGGAFLFSRFGKKRR